MVGAGSRSERFLDSVHGLDVCWGDVLHPEFVGADTSLVVAAFASWHEKHAAAHAALGEDLVHAVRMTRPSAVVRLGVGAEEPAALLASDDVRHQSQGGAACTQRPPTIVATTSTDSSSSRGHARGSRESTTRSAR